MDPTNWAPVLDRLWLGTMLDLVRTVFWVTDG